ncbi:hypothetical protein ABT117_38600 [Streptomyces sp. NPDC002262]|uniref:hypothetical protein n=1 Tax=Streptomyces sp. NPDC002262 TaxID=3154414 RepID=UPI0033245A50
MMLALGLVVGPLSGREERGICSPAGLVAQWLGCKTWAVPLLSWSLNRPQVLIVAVFPVASVLALASGLAGVMCTLVGVPLYLLVCGTAVRTAAAAARRWPVVCGGFAVALSTGLVLVVLGGGMPLFDDSSAQMFACVDAVLLWVPPVSALGAVASGSQGDYGSAFVQLWEAVVCMVLLLHLWQRCLED